MNITSKISVVKCSYQYICTRQSDFLNFIWYIYLNPMGGFHHVSIFESFLLQTNSFPILFPFYFMSLPQGPECTCPPGEMLRNGSTTDCDDIDECALAGTCSQLCNNTKGSYRCSCVEGYTLDSNKFTCKTTVSEYLPLWGGSLVLVPTKLLSFCSLWHKLIKRSLFLQYVNNSFLSQN